MANNGFLSALFWNKPLGNAMAKPWADATAPDHVEAADLLPADVSLAVTVSPQTSMGAPGKQADTVVTAALTDPAVAVRMAAVTDVQPLAAAPTPTSPAVLLSGASSFAFAPAAAPEMVVASALPAPGAVIDEVPAISIPSAVPDDGLSLPVARMLAEAAPAAVVAAAPAPAPAVVFIDPSATRNGDGSAANPFSSWHFAPLVAGTIYLQKAGTVVDGALVLRGEGTEGAPILISSYGTGAPPVVKGSLIIEASAHLTVTGFTVEGSSYAGVAVQRGSHDIIIAGNTIQDNAIGVWFSADSGGGNLVFNNTIRGNATFGVAMNKADHRADYTIIASNVIEDNGSHGLEINASGMLVTGNTVSGNGSVISGSSGIHVFAGVGGPDGFGSDNIIMNNIVTNSFEAGRGFDGNGIQLDQFTARNVVIANTSSGNDGAGIILYDSSSNFVSGNTLSGNALDRSGSHVWYAELMLLGEDRFDLTARNVVTDNVVTPRSSGVQPYWIDTKSLDNLNLFAGNAVTPANGDAAYAWNGLSGTVGSEVLFYNPNPNGGANDIWAG